MNPFGWIVLLVAAEWLAAVRLSFGYLSWCVPLAWLAAGAPGPGLAAALAVVWLTLLIRSRGRWREVLCDGLPASAAAAAHHWLGPVASLPVLFIVGGPLTVVLRSVLGPPAERELAPLGPQLAGILAVGPLAWLLAPQPSSLLLLLPIALGLRSSAGKAMQLDHFRAHRADVRQQVRLVHSEAELQAQQKSMLEARALALTLLQQLGTDVSRDEVLALLRRTFPQLACGFQSPPEGSRVHPHGLWVRPQQPLSHEQEATLETFLRYATLLLERAARLDREMHARQRLQWLLESAPRLAADNLREVGVEVAGRLSQTEAFWHNEASGALAFGVAPGLFLCFRAQPGDTESLRLWACLLSAAWRRNEAQVALTQANKLAAIGQLAAGVAHELNTPLGALTLALAVARESVDSRPDRAQSRLEQASRAVAHMQGVVDKLLTYARQSGQGRRSGDLTRVAEEAVALLHPLVVELDVEPVTLEMDPGEIQQVLLNLLVNAAQAGDRVRITLRADEHWAWIDVQDDGAGIDPAIRDRIFDPFFTTREVGQGTGLGLALSRQIAASHGGTLDLVSSDHGTRFRLRLPRA